MEPLSPVSDGQDEFFDTLESLHRRQFSSGRAEIPASHPSAEQLQARETSSSSEKEVEDHNNDNNNDITTTITPPLVITRENLPRLDISTRARRQLLHRMRQDARHSLTAGGAQSNLQHSFLQRRSLDLSQNLVESTYAKTSTTPHREEDDSENSLEVTQQFLCDADNTEKENDTLRLLNDPESPSQHNRHPPRFTPSPLLRDTHITASPGTRRASLKSHAATLAALTRDMDRSNGDDLFMQEAEDNTHGRVERRSLGGRSTQQSKRRSLPPTEFRSFTSMDDRRPRTSGGPSSRTFYQHDDAASVASFAKDGVTMRARRSSRYSTGDRQHISPTSPRANPVRSPESIYGRIRPFSTTPASAVPRRTSQLLGRLQESEGDSPAESSEPKQSLPESTSADSQTAPSTVWDELDDLKSRIKKLELTGKLPPTSGAAIDFSPQLERPRTATTAPTTIDSSPKRETTAEGEKSEEDSQSVNNIMQSHPLLQSALAKAKPLLNPALYRSLEATANDAMQLTAIANGTGAVAGSPINGGAPERHLRRKADMMCRNVTDLCLALCEGKHESGPALSIEIPTTQPTGRMSRAMSRESDPRANDRPLSRLEARRSSILGTGAVRSPTLSVSPRRENDELSASEVDAPSQYLSVDRRRYTRSSSRLSSSSRALRYDDISGDEDPTVRPPSRNGSEFSFRGKPTPSSREYGEPPKRSFSLRDSITNRRSSATGHRDLSRVASMSSDNGRRWMRDSTPPVVEEEVSEQEQHMPEPIVQPRQRMTSLGHFRQRALKETPLRSSSISRRTPQVMIE